MATQHEPMLLSFSLSLSLSLSLTQFNPLAQEGFLQPLVQISAAASVLLVILLFGANARILPSIIVHQNYAVFVLYGAHSAE
jgi:hypothetical protein